MRPGRIDGWRDHDALMRSRLRAAHCLHRAAPPSGVRFPANDAMEGWVR